MIRGPYKLKNKSVYHRAIELRKQGFGYRYIGKEIGISHDTVKHWVKHIELAPGEAHRNYSERIAAKATDDLKSGIAIRQCLFRKRGRKCEKCGLGKWLDKPITLEVNHKDGDNKNNCEENLELLCPNCHSYTPTWRRQKSSLVVELADTADLGSVH